MLKVVLFAACENAIIDQQTNALSLTNLLQDITINIIAGQPPPPRNAIIPVKWTAITVFQSTQDDKGKTFEQKVELADSGGVKIESPIAVFQMTANFHRSMNIFNGMPIGVAEAKVVRCLLREKGTADWMVVGEYPINILWRYIQ